MQESILVLELESFLKPPSSTRFHKFSHQEVDDSIYYLTKHEESTLTLVVIIVSPELVIDVYAYG